jgi:hypothetical protein
MKGSKEEKPFMKVYAPLLSILMLASCSHVHKTPVHTERSIATVTPIKRFISAAVRAEDNVAYKSAREMEDRLLSEVKANPSRFGLSDEASKKLKSLDDVQNERIMAEILAEAPHILKFTPKMKQASMKAIMDEAGMASHLTVSATNLNRIKLAPQEQTGLGRTVSLRLKNLKSNLVSRKIASEAQADKIYKNLFEAAQDLSSKAKGDPAQMTLARQIINYSTMISEKTGKPFLGKGGCMKIKGKDVLESKADIAFKTMNDVESRGLRNYDEIGEALQKNHAEVTNRTVRESCLAIKALTIGKACGGVYSSGLAPKDC